MTFRDYRGHFLFFHLTAKHIDDISDAWLIKEQFEACLHVKIDYVQNNGVDVDMTKCQT